MEGGAVFFIFFPPFFGCVSPGLTDSSSRGSRRSGAERSRSTAQI